MTLTKILEFLKKSKNSKKLFVLITKKFLRFFHHRVNKVFS